MPTQYGLENIRKRRLKIATFDDLNDPFELRSARLATAHERKAFEHWRREFAARYGMLCFSRGWQNPVQWSHYAAGHKGLCLGFDIPDKVAIEVQYRQRLMSGNTSALLGNNEMAAKTEMFQRLRTKYAHWDYEQEVRHFVQLHGADLDGGMFFQPFSSQLELRSVIVGSRSSATRAQLSAALGDLSPSVMPTRLAFQSFRVVKQNDASRWL